MNQMFLQNVLKIAFLLTNHDVIYNDMIKKIETD